GAVAAQQAQHARNPGTDLSSARLLRPTKRPPQSGWRRLVYVLSGRLLNPGESPADVRRRELTVRVNQPLLGCYKIGVLSLKGGVGKTTMTATLGATFASLRGDRVVAVDANPDRGTLSQKIPLETSATVRNLLRDAQRVRRYTDVRAYTSQGPSRLEVLASEQDPAVSEAFSEDDYRRTVNLLEHFYNIVLTDCGTGLMHSAMYGVLGVADQLIIVSSSSIDGARSASATMDWLDAHGHGELVRNSVAVVNNVSRSSGGVDLDRVAEHFAARCRAVVRVPFDPHLQEGAEVDLDRLDPGTRLALLELAAAVADAFASVHGS
ncbi:MAG: MinD/ParA family protein, partial [Pseudonocardia sp.]|nr:MinD/ParA family protein [Pseudonocardia sp.]